MEEYDGGEKLSKMFFNRLSILLPLMLNTLNDAEKSQVDREVENITGMDCDVAAKTLSKDRFVEVAKEAIRRVKKQKPQPKEMMAIA